MQRVSALLLSLCLCHPCLGQDVRIAIDPGGPARGWALDPRTGRVFAALEDAVAVFSAETGAPLARIPVSAGALRLLVCGRWLLVAHPDAPALSLIDLETDTLTGSIALEGATPPLLLAGDGVPWAVCTHADGASSSLSRIDPDACTVRAVVPIEAPAAAAAISPSGEWLLISTGTREHTPPARVYALDAEPARLVQVGYAYTHVVEVRATPDGQSWVLGSGIQRVDLAIDHSRSGKGHAAAVHPGHDLVASLDFGSGSLRGRDKPATLLFGRFSDSAPLGSVDLVAHEQAAGEDHPARIGMPRLAWYGDTLLFGWGSRAFLFDTRAAGIDAPPVVRFTIPSRVRLEPGEELDLRLAVQQPGAVRYALLDGPPGMRVEEGRLRWTAAPGTFEVRLEATHPEHGSGQAWLYVQVERPYIELPFAVGAVLATDAEGRRALVSGNALGARRERRLALVDLERGTLRELGARHVRLLAVAADAAYVVGYGDAPGDEVLACVDGEQLIEVPLVHSGHALVALPAGGVAMAARSQTDVYDGPELELRQQLADPRRLTSDPPVQLGNGLLALGTRVIDARDGRTVAVVGRQQGFAYARNGSESASPARSGTEEPMWTWAQAGFDYQMRGGWQRRGRRFDTWELHPDLPVALGVWMTTDPRSASVRVELEVTPLVGGESESEILEVCTIPGALVQSWGSPRTLALTTAGQDVLVGFGRRLVRIRLSEAMRGAPRPFGFDPRLAALTVEARAGELRLPVPVRGAERAALTLAPVDGARLEGQEVVIDPGLVWERCLAWLVDAENRAGVDREQIEDRFAAVFGFPAEGFPVLVPLAISAEDGQDQSAALDVCVAVLGPWAEVEHAIAVRQAAREAAKPPRPERGASSEPVAPRSLDELSLFDTIWFAWLAVAFAVAVALLVGNLRAAQRSPDERDTLERDSRPELDDARAERQRKRRNLALRQAKRTARGASTAFLWAAGLSTLGVGLVFALRGDLPEFVFQVILGQQIGTALVMWALCAVARTRLERAYLPAAIGLLILVPMLMIDAVQAPMMLVSPGGAIRIAIIGGLFFGARASLRYRRMEQEAGDRPAA